MEHLHYTTDEELDSLMDKRGYTFYRQYFKWGKTPAYRTVRGAVAVRFIDRGDVLNPTALLNRLIEEWRPASQEDTDYAAHDMRRELETLEALGAP